MYALNIWWVTRISTGNNRVQWYGDGRWQLSSADPEVDRVHLAEPSRWGPHPGDQDPLNCSAISGRRSCPIAAPASKAPGHSPGKAGLPH
ncbi:hypothetical protein ACFSTC_27275 [Nonomuraea ferruginea]